MTSWSTALQALPEPHQPLGAGASKWGSCVAFGGPRAQTSGGLLESAQWECSVSKALVNISLVSINTKLNPRGGGGALSSLHGFLTSALKLKCRSPSFMY